MTATHDRSQRTRAPLVDTAVRWLRRRLWSGPKASLVGLPRSLDRTQVRATLVVRAFYAMSLVWVLLSMGAWPVLGRRELAEPLWPVAWYSVVGTPGTQTIVLGGYLSAALAAAVAPGSRTARVAYAVMLLEYMALVNSFDKINHNLHAWLFVAIVLILLPGGWARGTLDRGRKVHLLTVFWSAQLVVLFTYTLTGIWKVGFAGLHLLQGHRSGLDLSAFSNIVADRLLQTDQDTILGELFVHNQIPGWGLYLATMYIETASVLIAFRPRLHRAWGLGLIGFHVGTQLVMGFTFVQNVALLGLLLVCSPLAPDRADLRSSLGDLPGVLLLRRHLIRRLPRRRSSATPPAVGPSAPVST